jgi:hypothetical protein
MLNGNCATLKIVVANCSFNRYVMGNRRSKTAQIKEVIAHTECGPVRMIVIPCHVMGTADSACWRFLFAGRLLTGSINGHTLVVVQRLNMMKKQKF